MILKNFDSIQRTAIFGRIWPTGISSVSNLTETHYKQDNNTVVRLQSGNSYQYQSYAQFYKQSSASPYSNLYGLFLGEQTSTDEVIAPEDYYDYQLTHPLWSTYFAQNSSNEVKYYTDNGINYLHITHTFTNTGTTSKLIREIGLSINALMDNYTSGNHVIVYRKVLPTYVEVAPQGNYIVDIKIPVTELAPNKPSA